MAVFPSVLKSLSRALTLSISFPLSSYPVMHASGPPGSLWGTLGRGRLHQLLLLGWHCALPEPALQ